MKYLRGSTSSTFLQPALFTSFTGLYHRNRTLYIYIYRCGLVAANGFAIRENMDAGGRNGGEGLFGNLHTHDL